MCQTVSVYIDCMLEVYYPSHIISEDKMIPSSRPHMIHSSAPHWARDIKMLRKFLLFNNWSLEGNSWAESSVEDQISSPHNNRSPCNAQLDRGSRIPHLFSQYLPANSTHVFLTFQEIFRSLERQSFYDLTFIKFTFHINFSIEGKFHIHALKVILNLLQRFTEL